IIVSAPLCHLFVTTFIIFASSCLQNREYNEQNVSATYFYAHHNPYLVHKKTLQLRQSAVFY
ncbi:MAG: hypothetical protein IJT13_02365, partial [Bacteroidaceae bacterium]|nr:hypothetical protein [Bacteroidaceae bacterium]